MHHALTGLDHVIVGVRDLDAARSGWARLGFNPTPRGRHVGWGTANYCLMFERDYIELLGIVDASQFTNGLDRRLEEREGLMGLVAQTGDPEATAAAWTAAGLQPAEPRALGRVLELPGGDVALRFRNVLLDRAQLGGLGLFACQHLTPELLRRPAWTRHPNGATGIASCTVVAPDPAALTERLALVFGSAAVTRTDTLAAIHTGSAVLLVASHAQAEHLHPGFDLEEPGAAPLAAVLAVKVADPDKAARFLGLQGLPHRRDASRAVLVDAVHANGVNLELVPG
ncbi:MAG: VOC family protein [Geminicoccaceae bacterium]